MSDRKPENADMPEQAADNLSGNSPSADANADPLPGNDAAMPSLPPIPDLGAIDPPPGQLPQTRLSRRTAFLHRNPLMVLGLLLMGAFTTSMMAPLGGLFVVEGLGQAPWQMTPVFAVQVSVTLITNRFFGRAIDRGVRLKYLLLASICSFALAMLVLGTFQNYWVYLTLASVLIGCSSGALSVMYSFGRLFAEQTGRDVVRFNALLRMQTSLGWMVGPALSLTVYGLAGFAVTFYGVALVAGIWLVLCLYFMPVNFRTHHPGNLNNGVVVPFNLNLLLACIPVFFVAMANSIFTSGMPLFFTHELGLISSAAGLELSVKCLVEVAAIYLCVALVRKIGETGGMLLSAAVGTVFFLAIYHAQTLSDVMMLGVMDGIYYGIFAGISMTFVQNTAPERPGVATSYYVSTLFIAGLAGNLATGLIATWFSFQATVLAASLMTALSAVAMIAIRRKRPLA